MKSILDTRFGSDEALGVYYYTDDGVTLTLAQVERMIIEHGRDNLPGMQSLFPDDTSAICCTNYAIQIARAMPGRVHIFGFANENNPTSRVAREGIHPDGHDFAVVDNRYLVDPWIRLVAAESGQIVFDLEDPLDATSVRDTYGPKECWTLMKTAMKEGAESNMHNQKFSTADADRLLGLSDQFMEDWETHEGASNPECKERRIEYDAIRDLFVNAPRMLDLLLRAAGPDSSLPRDLKNDLEGFLREEEIARLCPRAHSSERPGCDPHESEKLESGSTGEPFTVIGFYQDNGHIFAHHVRANDALNAFVAVAAEYEGNAEMVCTLPGHVGEGTGLTFPGEAVVDGATVLEQPEVFGTLPPDHAEEDHDDAPASSSLRM